MFDILARGLQMDDGAGSNEHCTRIDSDKEEPPGTMSSNSVSPTNISRRIKAVNLIGASRTAIARDPGTAAPKTSPQIRDFRRQYYPEASDREWNDWRWQTRNRIRELSVIEKMLELSTHERCALKQLDARLPIGVTPFYMGLVSRNDPDHPLRRTVIPTVHEFVNMPGEEDDPLCEDEQSPVPGLIHRYPDRALLLAHDFCSTYCRFCTRSRVVGHRSVSAGRARLEKAFDYIRSNDSIRDVLISGGDPLLLSDGKIEWILSSLRAIPHIEIIRIGTKVPAVLPQRITSALVKTLRRHHPLWMSLHFTHPEECLPEVARACATLADAGIPLGSQTVLLRGINDDVDTMKSLMHKLMMMRVRPYYLYQCDPIYGSSHFRTPVEKGLEIIRGLRGHTTGYAVPTFVVDAPGGGGKIPLMPDSVVGRNGDDLILRNYQGNVCRYPDQPSTRCEPEIEIMGEGM